jgi:D-citramalate synthase
VLAKRDIQMPQLVDYEVRIPRGGKADALTECTITWSDGKSSRKTRGVHVNQVIAAMNATIRMLNIQLHDSQVVLDS